MRIDGLLVLLLWVLEAAILLPFFDAGLCALNIQSTLAFVAGVVWLLFLIVLVCLIHRLRINQRVARKLIRLLGGER